MSKMLIYFAAVFCFVCLPCLASAQKNPVDVPACELARSPKDFDGKLVRVRSTVNVHFEDLTLGVANCDSNQHIWLAFGGDVPGIVASTANDNYRKPGTKIEVNGVSYEIEKDDSFRRFYALIAARHGDKPEYKVTATLIGVFLAGEETKAATGRVTYSGYGHLGCCALLVITRVSQVESAPHADLNVNGVVLGPNGKPVEAFAVIDDILGGSPPERQFATTNARGEFAFSNSGQQLRFENPKYRPLALTVEPGGAAVRVTLEDAKDSDWMIPACGGDSSEGRIGFSALFAIPLAMKSSPFESDGVQSLFVYPRGEEPVSAELIISRSPDETTEVRDSRDSKWFEERWIKDGSGNVIGIDARGQTDHGGLANGCLFRPRYGRLHVAIGKRAHRSRSYYGFSVLLSVEIAAAAHTTHARVRVPAILFTCATIFPPCPHRKPICRKSRAACSPPKPNSSPNPSFAK